MSAVPLPYHPADDRRLPTSLFGYDLVQRIADGAGSTLYAVSHPDTHQLKALKHVPRKTAYDDRYIAQVETEYKVGKQLEHPNLRKSLDLKVHRTLLGKTLEAGLLMDLVDGQPLDRIDSLPMSALASVFLQVARALHYLHGLGYVHCDLKPNNILVGDDIATKVIDLGQACAIGTLKERIQGTPDYIAPEQVRREAMTPRTDTYNFGATLYWALCDKKVPTLMTLQKSENSFISADVLPSPHELNRLVPETLSALAMDCIHLLPSRRADDSDIIRRLEAIEFVLRRSQKLREIVNLPEQNP